MIPPEEMRALFFSILRKEGFAEDRARQCADIFTGNSIDGVYTHGVNRFAGFVQYVRKGVVSPDATISLKSKFGGLEQWDGNLGPGVLNAVQATGRAMELATEFGMGCVALSNTNHWMRGGTYGWQAAKAGFVFIGWTNTIVNMPAWGARDCRLGNNPLVLALPFEQEAVVLDMAMTQFSVGGMKLAEMKQETLPVNGGYNAEGQLTNDPSAILASGRPLPVGYWKGAGLALLLDLLATVLAGGLSTREISERETEYGLSQVYIAINIAGLHNHSSIAQAVEAIIRDYRESIPVNENARVSYPGERALQARMRNLANGIPVMKQVWEEIRQL